MYPYKVFATNQMDKSNTQAFTNQDANNENLAQPSHEQHEDAEQGAMEIMAFF